MVPPLFRGCIQTKTHYVEVRNVPKSIKELFNEYSQGKEYMNAAELRSFAEKSQGESFTDAQAEAFIAKASAPNHDSEHATGIDLQGFVKLLLDPDVCPAFKLRTMTHDMTRPLAEYYVYTSHNSYLTGNQLWSRSSTTPIIAALNEGCRVIELDCWAKKGKIKVLHGGTLTSAVDFKDCIVAIKENAFNASQYPVIITIESHLPIEKQIEAAKILREVVGEALFIPSKENQESDYFLSPEELKGKIIISDKPLRQPVEEQIQQDPEGAEKILGTSEEGSGSPQLNPARKLKQKVPLQKVQEGVKKYDEKTTAPVEPPKADEFSEILYIFCEKPSEMQEKQVKGGPLVSGGKAIMANLSEPQLKKFIQTHPGSIIEYTKRNYARVYPFGLRFDSSNADPMVGWSHGCQLTAVNFQGKDRAAWLGKAFFHSNGGCGYVKKPEVFCRSSPVDYQEILNMPPTLLLKVKFLIGTQWHKVFDLFLKPDFYVLVAVKGIATDTIRKRTKVAKKNREPTWEDEEFEFSVRIPDLAMLRLEVWEEDRFDRDDFVGQCCIPVNQIHSGVRVIPLFSKKGKLRSSKLLGQFTMETLGGNQEQEGNIVESS